jgi:hypothetical protein
MKTTNGSPGAVSRWRTVVGLVLLLGLANLPAVAQAAQRDGTEVTDRLRSLTRSIEQAAPAVEESHRSPSDADTGYAALRLEEERTRRYIVMGLVGACVLSLVLVLTFLCRNTSCTTAALVNGSGLVLVIYATILVVVIARAEQQLTAAIGVLGAIIGYLFGTATRGAAADRQAVKGSLPVEKRSPAVS